MAPSWRWGTGTSTKLTPSLATSFDKGKVLQPSFHPLWARKTVSFSTRSPQPCLGMADALSFPWVHPAGWGEQWEKYLEGSQATEVCLRKCEVCFSRCRVDTASG